ncbi:hypothetical protein Scep_002806 [Stephania cephalantha]|uniref:Uncharacterized protein n=1 Tax=Stephania cephalantha TaxID=152367 RepID=A0AAP0LBP5_9MAGN
MEALLSQFSLLSTQALQDKNFDPSTIEDLMKLFELEPYWASINHDLNREIEQSQMSMKEAEDYLDSVMANAMDEYRRFEEESDRTAEIELGKLNRTADGVFRVGRSVERAASMVSKKYFEAAVTSAMASVKSAKKGLSSAASKKVHPS